MVQNRLRIRAGVALLVLLTASSCGEDAGCDPADVSCSDNTAPTVVSIDPPNGATNVARLPSVTVTFSEPVDPASFTAGAFVVGSSTGTVNVAGSTATFTPSAQLPEGALNSVHVEGVKDLAGHVLANAFTSSFTTRFEPLSAIAGPDQSVNRGAAVHLDASSSSATGATLAWTQLGGPAVGALSGATPTFTAPQEVATVRLELATTRGAETKRDTVIVWVLEDVAHTWWVSPTGNDGGAGTRAQPKATIQAAVEAANTAGDGGDVYVAGGVYAGNVELRSRVSIYGGFDPATWMRDIPAHRATLSGGAVHGSADSLFLEGVEIRTAAAVDSGASSIALHLHNSRGIVIRRNVIVAGAGAVGLAGAAGANGANGSTGGNGNLGGVCIPGSFITPGAGGASFSAGGAGGGGRVLSGDDGIGGTGPAGNGGPGAGAAGANGNDGIAGGVGSPGGSGSGGAAFGTVGPAGYTPSNGTDATDGTNGGGGGGGGGAGGIFVAGILNFCGPSGGGGGGGGQRSRGGKAGGGGGASIGVLLTGSSDAEVIDNSITTGAGGAGGVGGGPGFPGDGGPAGFGRIPSCDTTFDVCTGFSGTGGPGGRGGAGGIGGGGGGGPSIGLLQTASSNVVLGGNVFTLGAAGPGGSGGNPGAAGQRAEHLTN